MGVDEFEIQDAIERLAASTDRLGLNNAATQMGALEVVAKELREGSQAIATAIQALADAVLHLPIERG